MNTPPKRKHEHERDAPQLASSGLIPTEAAAPRYRSRLVCTEVRHKRSRTDLPSNTALGRSASSALRSVSGRHFSR